jgi:transposase, IS5 family
VVSDEQPDARERQAGPARVEHVFAEQKHRMGLFVRTIGIARATTKIGMANLVYNIKRLIFLRNLAIA